MEEEETPGPKVKCETETETGEKGNQTTSQSINQSRGGKRVKGIKEAND